MNGLNRALFLACGDRAIVSVQNPARLDRFSEPQPDVALFRPRADNYRTGAPPGPADVLLLVEVADSSLRYDRAVKLDTRAKFGEQRFHALGQIDGDFFMVAYTWRGENRRIIRAWKVDDDGKRRHAAILSGKP